MGKACQFGESGKTEDSKRLCGMEGAGIMILKQARVTQIKERWSGFEGSEDKKPVCNVGKMHPKRSRRKAPGICPPLGNAKDSIQL